MPDRTRTCSCVRLSFAAASLALTFAATPALAADFAVTYASNPPSTLRVGDFVSVSYDVENNDSISATSFTVGFVIDDGTNAYLLYEDTISSLGAFQSTSRTMSFTVPSGVDGFWTAGLVADPFDMVVETDEMDNVWVFSSQITIGNGGGGGTISVVSETLPSASVGSSYAATLRQTGATTPTWYVSSGMLPPGISLSTNGQLSGTPTSQGSFSFTATAEQTGMVAGSGSFTIDVTTGGGGGITIANTQLPEARVGVPYEAVMQASGGAAPYGYQVITNVPEWLMVTGAGEGAGTIRGTPDAVGSHEMLVYITDSTGAAGMASVFLTVVESGPLSVSTTHPDAVTGKAYSTRIVSGGIPPYNIQLASGSIPGGLVTDTNGMLTGVPASAGTFTFEVSVTDGAGASTAGTVRVAVTELRPLAVATPQVNVTVNSDADVELQASGGVPPYTWAMIGGTLPAGLQFDATAAKIIGHPTQVADAVATFSVTDADGTTAEADVSVKVTIWVPPGRTGADRRSEGCECVERSETDAAWLLLLVVPFFVRRQRQK